MTPEEAYYKAIELGKRIPELEPIISKDAYWSYRYALYVIKDRWEKGEETINKDIFCSYLYASYVIKGRWEQGELVISKDAKYSYYYAKEVIKGRLPDFMHNQMILSNDKSAKKYIEFIQ